MVAATLVLLCSRPLNIAVFGQVPWLLNVPSIAIIGREVIYTIAGFVLYLYELFINILQIVDILFVDNYVRC